MAVNNTFYATINELVARATSGTATAVVDYDSFVDVGKKITDIAGSDLRNNFVAALMNKIAKSILVKKSYEGAYKELDRGVLPVGNTIEMVMYRFFDAQVAPFVDLGSNGDPGVDMYVINKPEADVTYYINTNALSIPVTIQRDQLIKAFTSPAEMESFIAGIFLYIRNSVELFREQGRIGMVADWIQKLAAITAEELDDNAPSQHYNLLGIYNAKTSAGLTSDDCLYNEDFVKFVVMVIKKVMERTKKASESYNVQGVKTFTPASDRHLFLNSALVSAIEAYVPRPYLNNEDLTLTDYIDVPYWQNEDSPLTVSSGDSKTASVADEVESPKVLAVFLDRYALGEYLKEFSTETTPYNAGGKYWNVWTHLETRYCINDMANGVIFTIEDGE